ncbi:hypothetical protein [Sorangium sp. So ce124]|uniref:hypothetical protein n=1 Tax=Sorangium sp. So ce124 TaxID=3133280 RepID=UPI003F6102C1
MNRRSIPWEGSSTNRWTCPSGSAPDGASGSDRLMEKVEWTAARVLSGALTSSWYPLPGTSRLFSPCARWSLACAAPPSSVHALASSNPRMLSFDGRAAPALGAPPGATLVPSQLHINAATATHRPRFISFSR